MQFKLLNTSVFPPTMTSAVFSLFIVTTMSLVRPHGINSSTFIVYLQNLHLGFMVAFWYFVIFSFPCPLFTPYIVFLFVKPRFCYSLFSPEMSPTKTCKLLSDSSTTTHLMEFHPNVRTSPSY